MRTDSRDRLEAALLTARLEAYDAGEFVGQESFMRASEIRELAGRAGIGAGSSVLDLCCGVAGPGRFVAEALGCAYLGVDRSPDAIEIARRRARPNCRFVVSEVPPLPEGRFDAVLMLETLLAFPDKLPLFRAVSAALAPDGRFALTAEVGLPLTQVERALMPASDTVWPVPEAELRSLAAVCGLQVSWQSDCTQAHHATARSLARAFTSHAGQIREQLGGPTLDDLLTAHRVWTDWLGTGRIRKLALVLDRDVG